MAFLLIIFLFIVDSGLATAAEVETETNVEVRQENIVNQEQAGQTGSSSGISISSSSTSVSQGAFSSGGQPIIPNAALGYGGPWKDNWNIIHRDIYKHFETFWSTREARKATKGGGKIKSLYCKLPYPGSTPPRSKGVNVIFKLNKETTLPPSAVPIGVVIVKGGEKAVLWHLVARAVLEASKRGATWLKINRYDLTPQLTSSTLGIGLAGSGSKVGISAVAGVTGGSAWARAATESKPFLQGVAYVLAPSNSEKGK